MSPCVSSDFPVELAPLRERVQDVLVPAVITSTDGTLRLDLPEETSTQPRRRQTTRKLICLSRCERPRRCEASQVKTLAGRWLHRAAR